MWSKHFAWPSLNMNVSLFGTGSHVSRRVPVRDGRSSERGTAHLGSTALCLAVSPERRSPTGRALLCLLHAPSLLSRNWSRYRDTLTRPTLHGLPEDCHQLARSRLGEPCAPRQVVLRTR